MKIVTAVVNNLDFIEIQYHTLKKYYKGDYEFIVFNDAKSFPDFTNDGDVSIKNKIKLLCESLGIKCIDISNDHHKKSKVASDRTADSMNFILRYQKQNPDKYLLLDSDMFLVDYFEPEKYSDYECSILLQIRDNFKKIYFWNGLYYFDMNKLKNVNMMNWHRSGGCDTGGEMQKWLKTKLNTNPIPDGKELVLSGKKFYTSGVYFIKHLSSCSWGKDEIPDNIKEKEKLVNFLINDSRNINSKFFCEMYDGIFLHYRAGGNWRKEGLEMHKKLSSSLKEALLN